MKIKATLPVPVKNTYKKVKKELSFRQECNDKAKQLGGRLLNADGYILYLESGNRYYSTLEEFYNETMD